MSGTPQQALRETCSLHAATEVVVIIVYYRGLDDITNCLRSLAVTELTGVILRLVIVDNEGADDLRSLLENSYKEVVLVVPGENLGFAGGNNAGWEYSRQHFPDAKFVTLLNQDTTVDMNWISHLVDFLNSEPQAGSAQSKILLMDEPGKINTMGNRSQYLGFGFISRYKEEDDPDIIAPTPICFGSGCAVMIRASTLEATGLFDELMFMYCEDADLGWKIRQCGLQNYVVPRSVIYHNYSPTAAFTNYFYLERNRWLLVLGHFRLLTLLVLSPAFFFVECAQWFFAAREGLITMRVRVYVNLLSPGMLRHILHRRTSIRSISRISQAELMRPFAGAITVPFFESILLRRIANPLLSGYWWLARRLIFW